MNSPTKIIVAALMIVMVTSFLSGCTQNRASSESLKPAAVALGLTKVAHKVEKDAKLLLKATRDQNRLKVSVQIDNVGQKPVTSVQTWLSFDPSKIQGLDLNTKESSFELTAPYDNTFDNINGLVMVGRSTSKALTDRYLTVAELTFDIKASGTTMVNVFDYQEDLKGHTSVNVIEEGIPYNILIKPETPALILQN